MPKIFTRKDGLKAAKVPIGNDPHTGKRLYRFVYGATADEVRDKITDTLRRAHNGAFLTRYSGESRMPLGTFFETWLEGAGRGEHTIQTYRTYLSHVKVHIEPAIGHIPIGEVTPRLLQEFLNDLQRAGASDSLRHQILTVLSAGLNHAVDLELLARNPARGVSWPRRRERIDASMIFSADELKSFLKTAQEDRYYPLYVLAATTGMRQGEIFALEWSAVDLRRGFITVYHTLAWDDGGDPLLDGAKTNAAHRRIDIPEMTVEVLKAHRKAVMDNTGREPERWVFVDQRGGPLRKDNFRNRSFIPVLQRSGLKKITFHTLRHTHATLLLQAGVNIKVVSERLGHADVATTLRIYSHVMPTMQREAADRIGEVLGNNLNQVSNGAVLGVVDGK